MGGGRRKKGPGKTETPDDVRGDPLWEAYTREVAPLKDKVLPRVEPMPLPPSAAREDRVHLPLPVRTDVSGGPRQRSAQLDRRTETRLRRGQIPIDGRLDLHGHTQAEAEDVLRSFVRAAHQRGDRCLLIITGKGGVMKKDPLRDDALLETGVLKRNLKNWLCRPPLDGIVLKVVPAAPRHGGSGAFYVYLRRERVPEK